MFNRRKEIDAQLNFQELDMVKRNSAVNLALTIVSLLIITIITAAAAFTLPSLIILSITLAIWLPFIILHLTRKWIFYIKYIAIIGSALSTSYSVFTSPATTNFISIIYLVILALIYMDMKLSIFVNLYGFLLVCYMVSFQASILGLEEGSGVTYIIYYALISIVAFALLKISSNMIKQINTSREEAEQLAIDQEKQQKELQDLIATVSEKTQHITSNSEQSNIAFKEMNAAFQEIATGSSSQSNSTQNINESVSVMSSKLDEMGTTMKSLTEESVNSKELSETGQQQISSLTHTIEDFKGEIDGMSQEISQLIENLNETHQFSNTIKEIANQTSLLSLNASIEAARAGEHGKGFAVVADEIRKLAELSTDSAEKISEQLNAFSKQSDQTRNKMIQVAERMAESYEMTEETNNSFKQINTAIIKLNDLSVASDQLTQSINQSVKTISESTEELAAFSEESSASIQQVTATLDNCLDSNTDVLNNLKELESTLNKNL
ncbi:methyl-accepting chemotaxis protein [Aquibacillus rhizosphaerae]|uniref:Methyl-accepting chemotaxis protein n=1 Tax=Aquibacillus rhizosphaerae TaxID=3051431 RepID=A0ABT7L184_9BACI|nr:methyl-accepting chemotaxis protein [Aquibacillus sp. LR5S19]MDL4838942.1 methyl-accepting chemotaxis protein [Aquibacillus sp. LR5S19]